MAADEYPSDVTSAVEDRELLRGAAVTAAQVATLDVEGTPIVRAWNVVHTLSKLLSPAAEAFRYFMLERAEGHLAEKYGRLLRLPPAP